MSCWQSFALGVMMVLTPSMLYLTLVLMQDLGEDSTSEPEDIPDDRGI